MISEELVTNFIVAFPFFDPLAHSENLEIKPASKAIRISILNKKQNENFLTMTSGEILSSVDSIFVIGSVLMIRRFRETKTWTKFSKINKISQNEA